MFTSVKYYLDQKIDLEEVLSDLVQLGYEKKRAVVQQGEFAQRGSIVDIYPSNFESPIRIDIDDDQIRSIYSYNLKTSKSIWDHKIVIILPKKKSAKKEMPFSSDTPLYNFVDIERGDYVVHNNHGIGKYLGIQRMEVSNQARDHLVIEFKGGDRLYVPKHDMHLVQKYIGFHKKPPRLFKLGTKEWQKIRRQIEKRLQRLAAELLRVQAIRESMKGIAFAKDSKWQKRFEDDFPFEETPDQTKSTKDVKKDMESEKPMDRLVCGDVGYGKTEVALRAMFKAVMDNKQVAMLVPTTILAEQHFYNFSHRLKDFPVKIAMLNRFRTKAEQVEIIKGLHEGSIDIVVGTHRLLSKDISFKRLGLIVIDEEQRFGVQAKERLKHFRVLVDVLTLTATPIPRTLHMALSGSKDMSLISTPPQNRVPVMTHVVQFDEDLIQKAIKNELKRKGQVFFLHNRIEDIDQIASIVQRLAPKAQVAIAHGQMPGRLLEEIMLKYIKGEIDVLVCTTIIESGLDIPNANTLIINRADRFGLSDLHQLRGRVGRMDIQAYAYFITPPASYLSTVAKQRLRALEKYSDLGAGFQIAFEDMQIRGAGNLLGAEQHGYVTAIGFDLYCRLLKESVEHIKKGMEIKR